MQQDSTTSAVGVLSPSIPISRSYTAEDQVTIPRSIGSSRRTKAIHQICSATSDIKAGATVTEMKMKIEVERHVSIGGLVVKSVVAIDGPRVRFPADAFHDTFLNFFW
ncbi:hypothetical protein D8B26_006946 [Coccidioides posadasii str. Silveira]|uniref:uncharacterized protein n=1 Tax=Coccidioides posadasii (strain RMSCC 757 / Silveira) TaxID=443226 RepID=UPI001BED53E0|nr:hypothetical protein D8B26_006946 [Coccidioides posadasii str. Silveira]